MWGAMKPGVEIFHVGLLNIQFSSPPHPSLKYIKCYIWAHWVIHNISGALLKRPLQYWSGNYHALSNYLVRQLLSTQLASTAVWQMCIQLSYTKWFNATFSRDILPHSCDETFHYYLSTCLLAFLFINSSPPSCVRYSGCPRPPPQHRSPLVAHCTAPPSPVR